MHECIICGKVLGNSRNKYCSAECRSEAHGNDAKVATKGRTRKLTPRENWRLMGFTDEDFNKAQGVGVSNTQLVKQAGNSIVVQCFEGILRNLIGKENGKF